MNNGRLPLLRWVLYAVLVLIGVPASTTRRSGAAVVETFQVERRASLTTRKTASTIITNYVTASASTSTSCARSAVARRAGFFLDDLFGPGRTPKVPRSPRERNQQIVTAVRAAVQSPRTPSLRLIECEFPAVAQLNKLGDGSLRSAQAVDEANLETALALVRSLSSPLDNLLGNSGSSGGPIVWLLTSSAASAQASHSKNKNDRNVHSLRNSLPPVKSRDVCVLLAPCNRFDYEAAKRLAANGNAVVLVNGFAKDRTSVPGDATMAYYLKPLTYNSQIAGYLIRSYPGPWTVLDAAGTTVLETYSDAEILVPQTNTPDLRAAVRRVQKVADERAIRERRA